eukprot:CAMPEP_0113700502 /NCGR_PEP_ID=MMETSP0038_2-20120614/24001_1 /TAXON_ID=2898 /ORGANISM="Cryptomonas paramecium" /LENGTH=486 /DNA_ID=CAMNT_0000624183 /DNA_START=21 /DNA_END=1478 /DNA_ORIENTATION=- /assembly_acc=CAM_ASM_000170
MDTVFLTIVRECVSHAPEIFSVVLSAVLASAILYFVYYANPLRFLKGVFEKKPLLVPKEAEPISMMRADPPPNFWERDVSESKARKEGSPPPQLSPVLYGYGNSGAFQESEESWDRPSVPMGPAFGDTRMKRSSSGGKPDWYRMLSNVDGKARPDSISHNGEEEEISKVDGDSLRGFMDRNSTRSRNVWKSKTSQQLNYADYLQLDKILSAQELESSKWDEPVHDEHLFIVIHQAYELWFKQILFEVDSVTSMFAQGQEHIRPPQINISCARLGRVVQILRILVQQIDVLETMDAQDFQDFRDFLAPASGFQSKQFRILENTLGMSPDQRIQHSGCPYFDHLRGSDRQEVIETEKAPTVLSYVGNLLEKTMENLEVENFDFAAYMKAAINDAAEHDRKAILQYRTRMSPADEKKKLDELEKKREAHLRLFSEEEHSKLLTTKIRKLSFKATMGVVFVQSFRHQPAIAPLYCLITRLVEIDELVGQW